MDLVRIGAPGGGCVDRPARAAHEPSPALQWPCTHAVSLVTATALLVAVWLLSSFTTTSGRSGQDPARARRCYWLSELTSSSCLRGSSQREQELVREPGRRSGPYSERRRRFRCPGRRDASGRTGPARRGPRHASACRSEMSLGMADELRGLGPGVEASGACSPDARTPSKRMRSASYGPSSEESCRTRPLADRDHAAPACRRSASMVRRAPSQSSCPRSFPRSVLRLSSRVGGLLRRRRGHSPTRVKGQAQRGPGPPGYGFHARQLASLSIVVGDDGRGGADPRQGSGLLEESNSMTAGGVRRVQNANLESPSGGPDGSDHGAAVPSSDR